MAHVSVTINGRQYRMACEDGQENHLIWLSGDLDRRIGQLRAQFGEIGDMRLTMMAALTVADELVACDPGGGCRRAQFRVGADRARYQGAQPRPRRERRHRLTRTRSRGQ
jgi:cell division protein ZapA (FtsZ GTPase activity inhibitor)